MYSLQATMEFPVVKLADRLTYIILNYSSMVEPYTHSHPYKTRTAVAKVVCYIDIKRFSRLRLCCTEWVKSNGHRNHCFYINPVHLFFPPLLLFVLSSVVKHIYLSTYFFILYSFQSRFFIRWLPH